MKLSLAILLFSGIVEAKTFQNSYISFEVPDDWTCAQEGVAWTCTPGGVIASKEAVIVLAAKVAGPEDNLNTFQTYLAQPKKIVTKVGTPMPSQVMYARPRALAGSQWIQAQHLGSEIQEYYTLYLATVKEQLAILVSFSSERNRYQVYNPIFDRAIRTLKITANQQLLFPKTAQGQSGAPSEAIGINVPPPAAEDMMPPPPRRTSHWTLYFIALGFIAAAIAAYLYNSIRKPKTPVKKRSKK